MYGNLPKLFTIYIWQEILYSITNMVRRSHTITLPLKLEHRYHLCPTCYTNKQPGHHLRLWWRCPLIGLQFSHNLWRWDPTVSFHEQNGSQSQCVWSSHGTPDSRQYELLLGCHTKVWLVESVWYLSLLRAGESTWPRMWLVSWLYTQIPHLSEIPHFASCSSRTLSYLPQRHSSLR